jgi:hypothetical protein
LNSMKMQATCVVCDVRQAVEKYGDWECSQCRQEYAYDEGHTIKLTTAQVNALRAAKGLGPSPSLVGRRVRTLRRLSNILGDVLEQGEETTVLAEELEKGEHLVTLASQPCATPTRFTGRIGRVQLQDFEVIP